MISSSIRVQQNNYLITQDNTALLIIDYQPTSKLY